MSNYILSGLAEEDVNTQQMTHQRQGTTDKACQPIVIGHLNDPGDLKFGGFYERQQTMTWQKSAKNWAIAIVIEYSIIIEHCIITK